MTAATTLRGFRDRVEYLLTAARLLGENEGHPIVKARYEGMVSAYEVVLSHCLPAPRRRKKAKSK